VQICCSFWLPRSSFQILAAPNLKVYTSNGISNVLSITQNSKTVQVSEEKGYFHIEEENNVLKLYIPIGKKEQSVCLRRNLPISLLKHFGIQNSSGGVALGSIITAPDLFVVNEILLQDCIISVESVDPPAEEDSNEEHHSGGSANNRLFGNTTGAQNLGVDTLSVERASGFSRSRADSQSSTVVAVYEERHTNSSSTVVSERPIRFSDGTSLSPRISSPSPSTIHLNRVDLYRQLLSKILIQAMILGNVPQKGTKLISTLPITIDFDPEEAIRCSDDYTFNMGAAGELLVSFFLS
jgi:hypothetical protein